MDGIATQQIGVYARGELVEPVKPIVYYLDPATPAERSGCSAGRAAMRCSHA